jgi:RNA polymerase sigma-70 factor (ECF subfamily)
MTEPQPPTHLAELVARARAGDVDAYGRLVQSTQAMATAAARAVLREPAAAEDVVQESYLRAFRRLKDLDNPAAFPGWLRRIVITGALNVRRSRRVTMLRLDEVPDVPVLDEAESGWTEAQRAKLAGALLTLTAEERRLCDRRYHGHWSIPRLAVAAGVDEAAMRKRLQRLRDKLRKEIEMAEQRSIRPEDISPDLPAAVVELLARPELTDFPENPVGRLLEDLRAVFADCTEITLPEVVDLGDVGETIAADAMYVEPQELHRIDATRILRYDMTLPLLLNVRYHGQPLRLWATGKTYRKGKIDATHLEAFHQAEVFCLEDRSRLDAWQVTARVLQSIDRVLPGRALKIVPTRYAMCSQSWELEIEQHGLWYETMAWGVYTDRIVRHLGGDPSRHVAVGVGYGLERVAMLKYGIDDIRKIETAQVA